MCTVRARGVYGRLGFVESGFTSSGKKVLAHTPPDSPGGSARERAKRRNFDMRHLRHEYVDQNLEARIYTSPLRPHEYPSAFRVAQVQS
jgi:hypothetical protein